jgi:phage-related minor tail protein
MDQPIETWTVAVTADTSSLQQELANAARYGRQFSAALMTAFEGVALRGKSLGDVLRALALSLSRMTLHAAFRPLEQGYASLFTGLFSGGLAFGKGGVVRNALPVPFAAGGVIASPIAFPLAGGRVGLAGERGPEAIMPLARGPDGRLGVRTQGGSGVSVTFNVTTPDAESFRRSETQIAALLARAVALGQRNL